MFTREFVINPVAGLHAQVATALAAIAKASNNPIYLACLDGRAANALHPLEILGLAIQPAETVIVILKTPDSQVADSLFAQVAAALS